MKEVKGDTDAEHRRCRARSYTEIQLLVMFMLTSWLMKPS